MSNDRSDRPLLLWAWSLLWLKFVGVAAAWQREVSRLMGIDGPTTPVTPPDGWTAADTGRIRSALKA